MMKHSMRLIADPFKRICDGSKKIELRVYDKKRQSVLVGDTIEFTNRADSSQTVLVVVKDLLIYSSFSELLSAIDLSQLGNPHIVGIDGWVLRYRELYSESEEKRDGVLGIRFERI